MNKKRTKKNTTMNGWEMGAFVWFSSLVIAVIGFIIKLIQGNV